MLAKLPRVALVFPFLYFVLSHQFFFKRCSTSVTGFNSGCKSKVTVTLGGGSACKAHAVTGDAFSSALGTVLFRTKLLGF
jgi:hypothetical protein